MSTAGASPPADPTTGLLLPSGDPALEAPGLDLERLTRHWARQSALRMMTAEEMRGADARAQRLGVSGDLLMEEAGTAVGAVARALLGAAGRDPSAPLLILCGPGNNGGDGFVAARHLSRAGLRSVVVLVSGPDRPSTPDAVRNWERLSGCRRVERMHAPGTRDVGMLLTGIERAALVVDALLGTGVRGLLREPIRGAVDLTVRARSLGVPVLAVDTPTALDVTSGRPSDPCVLADATVTFHRPKRGLVEGPGRRLAGRVLVAPIGIPVEADRG
jgi:ADP-dependent NAD(P)H-hydrate dehydratase / NAD(P)H-hydrate epimerase